VGKAIDFDGWDVHSDICGLFRVIRHKSSSCPSHVLIGMTSMYTMQSSPDKDGVTYCNQFLFASFLLSIT